MFGLWAFNAAVTCCLSWQVVSSYVACNLPSNQVMPWVACKLRSWVFNSSCDDWYPLNGFLQAQSGGWVGCAFLRSKKFAVPPTSLILQFSFHTSTGVVLVCESSLMDSNFSLNKTWHCLGASVAFAFVSSTCTVAAVAESFPWGWTCIHHWIRTWIINPIVTCEVKKEIKYKVRDVSWVSSKDYLLSKDRSV